MARVLNGKRAADAIRGEVGAAVAGLVASGAAAPCLAAVLVGDDPASTVYVRNKIRACKEAGIIPQEHRLAASTSEAGLVSLVRRLGEAPEVDGILVQMPLPQAIDRRAVIEAMDPSKDVDGFHPVNVGRLWSGEDAFVPCTPLGVIELLDREGIGIQGAEAVIVGRSEIVGKPMAALLLSRHATVTVCHSRTRNLAAVASRADILIAAMGKPAYVTREFIKPGATVVDVGINRATDASRVHEWYGGDRDRLAELDRKGYTLVGDVHPAHVASTAGAYTPVPGGVGPLTVALLLKNTLKSALARREESPPRGNGP